MRLVSLCPSTTRLIFDLGRGGDLVGITKFCIHPAEAVAGIEKVGGTKDPKIERILALKPDLVLLNREENRREDWEALDQAGISCHLSFPRTVADCRALVADLGGLLHAEAKATQILSAIDDSAERAQKAASQNPNVPFAYLIWRKPWMTVNSKTYISKLLSDAGGLNVFADAEQDYPAITAQQIAAAKPRMILLSSEPFPFKQKHIDELAAATGLPKAQIHLVDGELLSWHGSHTADGLDYAVRLFHQDVKPT